MTAVSSCTWHQRHLVRGCCSCLAGYRSSLSLIETSAGPFNQPHWSRSFQPSLADNTLLHADMTSALLLCLALLLYAQTGVCLGGNVEDRTPDTLKSLIRKEVYQPIRDKNNDLMTASYSMRSLMRNEKSSRALAANLLVPFLGQPYWMHKPKSGSKEEEARPHDFRAAGPSHIWEMLDAYKKWRNLHGYGNGGGRWGR